jgi:hypothetical protein
VRVVAIGVAEDHELVLALSDNQLDALDAGEWLEGRTGRAPAIRAMAVHCIEEFVSHGVADCAAVALSAERAAARLLHFRQAFSPSEQAVASVTRQAAIPIRAT